MSEIKMPAIGLGTFLATNQECVDSIKHALKVGYRHIDTAVVYNNHKEIGIAIQESEVLRSEIFITSKIPIEIQTYDQTITCFEEIINDLGVEYLDLCLIHWPLTKEKNAEVWRALEYLEENKKVKAIGVSNFNIHHLEDLFETANTIPMMNQVEVQPHLIQTNLQKFCEEHGIALTAYGQFGRGNITDEEVLINLAKKHQKSVQQIILRWLIQRNIFVIPKSVTEENITSNFEIMDFKLTLEEMKSISKLNRGKRYYGDPDNYYSEDLL